MGPLKYGRRLPKPPIRDLPNWDDKATIDYRRTFNSQHGAKLTADEVEFGRAMEAYKTLHRRPFPTCSEVLEVLKSLGYAKQPPPEPPAGGEE